MSVAGSVPFGDESKRLLMGVSTATLTTQLFKRGLRNVFMSGLRPLNPAAARFAAPAFTLRFIPAREDVDQLAVFQDREHPQRRAIETIPAGHALVMDCRRETRAASAGDILITRLIVRGAAAIVTDGGLRDTPELAALAFPVFCAAPAAPLNLVLHHAADVNVPIGCAGVPVYPGDVLVGDAEGVVVIPQALADEVARDSVEQERMERFVILKVRKGAPLPGTYPPGEATMADYRRWVAAGEPADW
ncbi:MAG: ribonuclease activity regulator RraA [Alphaproteobacteria bacterium]